MVVVVLFVCPSWGSSIDIHDHNKTTPAVKKPARSIDEIFWVRRYVTNHSLQLPSHSIGSCSKMIGYSSEGQQVTCTRWNCRHLRFAMLCVREWRKLLSCHLPLSCHLSLHCITFPLQLHAARLPGRGGVELYSGGHTGRVHEHFIARVPMHAEPRAVRAHFLWG